MRHGLAAVAGVLGVLGLSHGLSAQTFRSGVLMVPVDVRVLDAQGKPVSGLVKDDCVVLEDGAPQPIVEFTADTARGERRPRARRVFLLDANRHWIGVPPPGGPSFPGFGIVEVMVSFIENQLAPEDLVGFSARGRVTDITRDHAGVVEVIRRYQEFLRAASRRDLQFLVRLEGIRFEPPDSDLSRALDEVFAPGSARTRSMKRSRQDFSAMLDDIGRESFAAVTQSGSYKDWEAKSMANIRQAYARELLADIDTLKNLDGEKHVVSVGTSSFATVDGDRRIADIASAARVSLHVMRLSDPNYTQREQDMSIQNITERTGGLAFLERMPIDVFAAIQRFSVSGYHLSYMAPSAILDGRTHTIDVRLRNGLKGRVVTRRSYIASTSVPEIDIATIEMREAVLQALAGRVMLKDIGVRARVSGATANTIVVTTSIGVAGLVRAQGEAFVGRLEVAVFCYDKSGRLVTEDWKDVGLNLSRTTYDRSRPQVWSSRRRSRSIAT